MITSIKFGELFQDMLSKFNVVSNTITTADACFYCNDYWFNC